MKWLKKTPKKQPKILYLTYKVPGFGNEISDFRVAKEMARSRSRRSDDKIGVFIYFAGKLNKNPVILYEHGQVI